MAEQQEARQQEQGMEIEDLNPVAWAVAAGLVVNLACRVIGTSDTARRVATGAAAGVGAGVAEGINILDAPLEIRNLY